MRRSVSAFFFTMLLAACSPPKPSHPALSPVTAQQLIRFNTRAENHLRFAKTQDPTCEYVLRLPDQSNHPDTIQVDHIVTCSGRNNIKAVDARVEFHWNKEQGKWEISRFGG